MAHRLIGVALATGFVLGIAAPVAAWSGIGVAITDDQGGTISGTGEVVTPTLLVAPALDRRPAGDLGPRFAITYTIGPSGPVVAVQDLYPYAPGGPVAYTASAGMVASHPYSAGWRQADPSVLRLVVTWGLPEQAGQEARAGAGSGDQAVTGGATEAPVIRPAAFALGELALLALVIVALMLRPWRLALGAAQRLDRHAGRPADAP